MDFFYEQYPQEQTTMECELADINNSTDKNMTITEESLEENKEQLEVDKAQDLVIIESLHSDR